MCHSRVCTRAVRLTVPLASAVPDLADHHLDLAARTADGDLLAAALAEERATQGGLHAHPDPAGINLVRPDDLVCAARPVLVLQGDPGSEPDPLGVGLLFWDDDGRRVQAALEEADPPVDLPEPLLAIDVLGV